MSYCVRCGVELENGTPACPLCQTPVIDPHTPNAPLPPPLYPPVEAVGIPKISRRVILILFAILHMIPTFVTLACDLSLTAHITWSGFVLGAAIASLGSIAIMLYATPLRSFGKVIVMGMIWSAYTFFVEYLLHGKLRIPFALPLVIYGTLMLSLLFLVGHLMRKYPRPLRVVALFLLFAGGFCILIEFWINFYFAITPRAIWSIYPAGTAFLLSSIFWVIDRSTSLKARLKKKLFI